MKKKIWVWAALLLALSCSILACSKEENPPEKPTQAPQPTKAQQQGEGKEGEEEIRGDGTVIWTMQDALGKIPESNINLLNEKLKADGYSCTLAIRYVPQEINYYERLSELLRTGETDIATFSFISFSGEKLGDTISMIREGNVEPLGDYLSAQKGQALWNACYEEQWKASEIEYQNYLIPSQTLIWDKGYLAFHRDYFTEEEVGQFSWDIKELGELLEGKDFSQEVVPIYSWNNIESNACLSGYLYLQGVFAELETGTIKNPFEAEQYKELLRAMNSLYQKGMIRERDRDKEEDIVENNNFAIWRVAETDNLFEKQKEKLILLQFPYAYQSSIGNTGLSKNAKQKEAALELLTLLYTEADYANLLIYGKEGTDYQVIDGFVCNMRGEPKDNYFYCYMTGIYDNVLPSVGDYYPVSRKQTKDELYYSDARKKNVLLGFHIDNSTFDEQMLSLHSVVWDTQYLWMEENFEEAWDAAAQAFLEAGGEKVVAELERQIEEWKKKR